MVITGFRVHKIKTAAIFAAMDTTVDELKETVREAFGVDTAKYGLPHKVEWANIHNARLAVKVNQEVKSKVDAVARAHGQPIQKSYRRLGVHDLPIQTAIWDEFSRRQTACTELFRVIRRTITQRCNRSRNSGS